MKMEKLLTATFIEGRKKKMEKKKKEKSASKGVGAWVIASHKRWTLTQANEEKKDE